MTAHPSIQDLPVEAARGRLDAARSSGLSLDLTRGKPSPEQLDLAQPLLDIFGARVRSGNGTDCRNYGVLEGVPEARRLFAAYLDVEEEETWVQDNSSLRLMHDVLAWCRLLGTTDGGPWVRDEHTRFLCPAPGYDRHFHLCAHLGIEVETVPFVDDGPDLEVLTRRVAEDPTVKGMFCVPRFSNPTGHVYSDATVRALAEMETAAPDFRIFWDNAYAHHALRAEAPVLAPLLSACKAAGHPERAFVFGSTSKITLAGAGVSLFAAAGRNLDWFRSNLSKQSIGPNKILQLAHVDFLGDLDGILQHMRRHAELLRPRFDAVLEVFRERLEPLGICHWTDPAGGYFISLDTRPGCAARTIELAADAGVRLTPAGSTYPGDDPEDRNIRLAPSFPAVDEVRRCAEVVADALVLATAEAPAG